MDNKSLHKARLESLNRTLENLLSLDDDALKKVLENGLLRGGSLARGQLAEMVGFKCKAATFRQNPDTLGKKIIEAEKKIKSRGLIYLNEKQEVNLTKQRIGQDNEDSFLAWLEQVGTSHLPAPMNHNDRLYLKALWAIYSEQELLDIKREPSWFRTREKVKKALEELDVKLVRGEVETIKMDAESIIDDMEDTMTNTLVRKLRSEVKELKEKLAAERIARKDAELKAKQNELLAQQVHNGKMASYQ